MEEAERFRSLGLDPPEPGSPVMRQAEKSNGSQILEPEMQERMTQWIKGANAFERHFNYNFPNESPLLSDQDME